MAPVHGVVAMIAAGLAALWRRGGVFMIPLVAVAGGIGVYAVAQASWPWLLAWWPWLLAGGAGLVIYGAWWLWWGLPKLQADQMRLREPKERADAEDNFRKTIGQLLGGAAVLLGAGFAYLQFQQQQQSSHDLLISNQVAKGFELFGNKKKDNITLRLGGIYALEGVMNASEQYNKPVLEALSAFVRENAKEPKAAETQPILVGVDPLATDIQAALTVVGRRKIFARALLPRMPDLRNTYIPGANLLFANLSGAELAGANLGRATLIGANLTQASLMGADLGIANLNLADLTGAVLWDANLTGANLSKANLTRASLNVAHLNGAFLGRANLTGADLSGADLTGARLFFDVNLTGANLSNTNLTGASLFDANLLNTNLTGANLTGANLTGATGLVQEQLEQACGTNVKLDLPLKLEKPCPPK
jgi:uncharacterized protein YjbI with pentapeptide repeats